MASDKISSHASVEFNVILKLNEDEARAMDALVGYGFKPFVKGFLEGMGRAYMEPYIDGLESLFAAIEDQVRPSLGKIDKARELLKEMTKPVMASAERAGR